MSKADNAKTTKEKAAAARAAAEAEQRKRDNRVRLIGGIAIGAVVAVILGVAIWSSQSSSTNSDIPTDTVADAAVPEGVLNTDDAVDGVEAGNIWGYVYKANPGKPTLAIWEDFQCPACAKFEETNGVAIRKLADDGKVTLVYRPTTFIEKRFAGTNPNSSTRATSAYGCAIDAGKGTEYASVVYANQPPVDQEGDGWSQQQLIGFGADAGISEADLPAFETCVNDLTYAQWATNSYNVFIDTGVPGTPSGFLNGTEVPSGTLSDPAALEALIAEQS
jgi:protein-disulfide isomerase